MGSGPLAERRHLLRDPACALVLMLVAIAAAPAYAQEQKALSAPSLAPPKPKLPVELASEILETIARLPVTVGLQDGTPHNSEIVVTHYRPQGAGPFPAVIVNHGRSLDRADPPRIRYVAVARYFARRGFAVFVPTRVGYGDSGLKPDPEFARGDCNRRDFGPPLAAMLRQIEATWSFAKSLPFVDAGRLLLVGQSYGGFAAIGATGHDLPGLVGAINFAGGGGGNPSTRPANPCAPDKLGATMAAAGHKSKVPTLWLYAENDKYWGAQLPRTWHADYVKGGGRGEIVMFPPYGEDGHKLIEGLSLWRPKVDAYLAVLGFAQPRASGKHIASGFAPLLATDKVPFIDDKGRSGGYAKFLAGDLPRAFAVAPNGAWGASWGQSPEAPSLALEHCAKHAKSGCRLYAVDDQVVFTPEPTAKAARVR